MIELIRIVVNQEILENIKPVYQRKTKLRSNVNNDHLFMFMDIIFFPARHVLMYGRATGRISTLKDS